jgi:hypothetical protein
MKNPKNTLSLDLRCEEEGRCLVSVGIDAMTSRERAWLFDLLKGAQQGRQIAFGVETSPAGEQVIRFTVSALEAQNATSEAAILN